MLSSYEDIFALADRLGEKPRWFDANGVPRFCDHHPRQCADIYAYEVALVLISCQRCALEIPVQISHGHADLLHASRGISLAQAVRDGSIHYGDPPTHDVNGDAGNYCHAGCTMSCWDLRVIEFWKRSGFEWVRAPELEIELPDVRDPNRAAREEFP